MLTDKINEIFLCFKSSFSNCCCRITDAGLCLFPWQTGYFTTRGSEGHFWDDVTLSILLLWSVKPSRRDLSGKEGTLGRGWRPQQTLDHLHKPDTTQT